MEENKNITNTEPNNIYSKIIDKKYTSLKFNQIVLGTKKLITNSTNFKDYSKEYEEVTKITTFKSPDEDAFPILKNEEFVSLGRVKYSYDSRKNRTKKTKLISHLFGKKKIKKFSFSNKSLNENKNTNKNKTININLIKNHNLLGPYHKSKIVDDNNNLCFSIVKDNNDNQILSGKNIKYNERIFLSVDNNKRKNHLKIDTEINSSVLSNMQQNLNSNSKDILLSPLSNSTTTQTSFFNKNQIKKIKGKSMNYYRNNQTRNNMFIIKKNLDAIFKHKKTLYNNRILLRDILLQEKDYFNLKYEQEKIFINPEHYNEYIRTQMILLKKKNLELKAPSKFEKIFENSKFGKPKLTLNSIIIEFKQKYSFDNKGFNKDDKQTFIVPFEYIPLFYFNHLNRLKELLVSIFYLDNTYTTFYSKYDNIGYILRSSSEFKEENEYGDSKKDVYKKAFTYKLQISHSQTLNKGGTNILRSFKKPSKSIDSFKLIDIFNTEYSFNHTPNYFLKFLNNKFNPNRNKNKIYFNKKNIFEYIWLTPSYQYLVTIKTPEISFKINGIEIKKNIDIELLFYLSEHNFKDWDFYVIEYLFSYFDFIYIIQHLFSSQNPKNFFNLKYHYDFKNNVFNLSQERKMKYSKNNTKLEYIFTDDNLVNHIKILHNYKLFVFNKKINPNYQFCFHLNFIQMKSLYSASKKQGIKYLIEKIIIMDKDNMKIKLNYDYLDNFCKEDLNILEPLLPSTTSIKGNKYNFNINDTKFCLFYPMLETIRFNAEIQRNHNCFESNLEEEIKDGMNANILDSLFKNDDVYKWPSIIEFIDNKEKLKKQAKRASIVLPNLNLNPYESRNAALMNTISSKKLMILDLNT